MRHTVTGSVRAGAVDISIVIHTTYGIIPAGQPRFYTRELARLIRDHENCL
jgi:hypothetical protein